MLNLSQRLILGCALLAGLTLGLLGLTHRALAATGQLHLAWAFVVAAILVEIATVYLVLGPIRGVARDAHKIAQGNLEHRTAWKSRDDFGVIAAELNRLAVRLRDLHDSEAGRNRLRHALRSHHRARKTKPRIASGNSWTLSWRIPPPPPLKSCSLKPWPSRAGVFSASGPFRKFRSAAKAQPRPVGRSPAGPGLGLAVLRPEIWNAKWPCRIPLGPPEVLAALAFSHVQPHTPEPSCFSATTTPTDSARNSPEPSKPSARFNPTPLPSRPRPYQPASLPGHTFQEPNQEPNPAEQEQTQPEQSQPEQTQPEQTGPPAAAVFIEQAGAPPEFPKRTREAADSIHPRASAFEQLNTSADPFATPPPEPTEAASPRDRRLIDTETNCM